MENHGFDDDTTVMGAPFNLDALLHDMSMARLRMTRTPSTTSSRGRMGKVTKPGSAGNSPQYGQRRRTSASHRLAKYFSDLYPYPSQRSQHLTPQSQPTQQMSSPLAARPLSWHPSTMSQPIPEEVLRQQRMSLSLAGYETVQMNGIPTPMTQPAMTPDLPSDSWFRLDALTIPQSIPAYGYPIPAAYQQTPNIYGQYSYPTSAHTVPNTMQPYSSPATNSTTSMWPSYTTPPPSSVYTAPPTPEMFPIQRHSDPLVAQQPTAEQEKEIDDGPELVGMGIYDTRPDFGEAQGWQGSLLGLGGESTGKGLKLEETWEPPEEDEDDARSETSQDAENEDDDDDDDDDTMEHPTLRVDQAAPEPTISPHAPLQQEHHVSQTEPFPKMYGDMASQTFFYDGGEGRSGNGVAEPMVLSDEEEQMWLRAMMAEGIAA